VRIVHVTHDLAWGGVQRYLADTLPAMARRGHTVQLVLVTGGGPLVDVLEAAGMEVACPPPFGRGLRRRWAALHHAAQLIARLDPDVLHSHLPWGHAAARIASLAMTRRPVRVASVHGRTVALHHRLLLGWAAPGVAVWHRVSLWVRAPGPSSVVLAPGIPPVPAAPSLPPGFDRGGIGVVSRLTAGKGVDRVIRALALLPPAITLTVVGEGPEHGRLARLAVRLGVSSRITWLGAVDARPLLPTFGCLAAPSHYEGYGFVVGEALQAGIPVVASDILAHRAWAEESRGVLLVPPHPAAWAERLYAALQSAMSAPRPDIRGVENHAEQLLALYAAVGAGSPRRSPR